MGSPQLPALATVMAESGATPAAIQAVVGVCDELLATQFRADLARMSEQGRARNPIAATLMLWLQDEDLVARCLSAREVPEPVSALR